MTTTLKTRRPRQTEEPAPELDRRQGLTAGVVGLVLGIILTSVVVGVVLVGVTEPADPGIFSPERSRTQVPEWMTESPEVFSPERSRTQVPEWMTEAR
jgi:hypothetical protein